MLGRDEPHLWQPAGDVSCGMLRNHLGERDVQPESCDFRRVAHGPIVEEVPGKDMEAHKVRRDIIGALEKRLRDDLHAANYEVLNEISCSWPLDEELYAQIESAFAVEFPALKPV